MNTPYFVILAGPNGAGKTTFARANLSAFIDAKAFLNADEIARSIRPDDVAAVAVEAGRRMLEERRARLSSGMSFCIETTLATRTLLRFVTAARDAAFTTRLIFLFTPSPHLNDFRVKQRVMAGGHNIDTATIRRRHRLGLLWFADYWEACDEGVVFDARSEKPREVLVKDDGMTKAVDPEVWTLMRSRLAMHGACIPRTDN